MAYTAPRAAREAIAGRIFEGVVAASDVPALRGQHHVTQELLVEGRHHVRVYAPDGAAPAGFTATTPTLEDAYLVTMRIGALPAAAEAVTS